MNVVAIIQARLGSIRLPNKVMKYIENYSLIEVLIKRLNKSQEINKEVKKNYSSTIEVDLPHEPGALGNICSLIGLNKGNIVNVDILERKEKYLKFSFDLQIKDLKNFTNLISQIKQSNLNFKIIRHKQKKNAFIRRIFENFKRN